MSSEYFNKVEAQLTKHGYTFERKDFNRPWGGFFVIEEAQQAQFIDQYFDDIPDEQLAGGLKVSPKILLVAPGKRLSWQYHHRRKEVWQVVTGEVGIVRSDTDEETPIQTYKSGDQVQLAQGERHRLVGLEEWGMVAEIWIHTDKDKASDENDIVRLQDDFARETPK